MEVQLRNRTSPSKEEVREYLVGLLVEIGKVPTERITDTACVDGDLRMESVAFVEIQIALEEEFDIEIDPVQMLELNEFAAIVDYLHDRSRVA
jgi:acyl carrier protein